MFPRNGVQVAVTVDYCSMNAAVAARREEVRVDEGSKRGSRKSSNDSVSEKRQRSVNDAVPTDTNTLM